MPKKKIDPVILRFLGGFLGMALLLSVLLQVPWVQEQVQNPYTRFIARLDGWILGAMGIPVTVSGTLVRQGNYAVEIKRGCDGLDVLILFLSAVAAYPFSWKSRAAGILLGGILIFFLNLIRTVALFLIGRVSDPATFEIFHVYIWQFAIILLVLVFWIYWVGREKRAVAE